MLTTARTIRLVFWTIVLTTITNTLSVNGYWIDMSRPIAYFGLPAWLGSIWVNLLTCFYPIVLYFIFKNQRIGFETIIPLEKFLALFVFTFGTVLSITLGLFVATAGVVIIIVIMIVIIIVGAGIAHIVGNINLPLDKISLFLQKVKKALFWPDE